MDNPTLQTLLISPEMTLKQAMQQLSETAQRILFAADDQGRLVGTITDGDIRRGIIAGMPITTPVAHVMKTEYLAVRMDAPDLRQQAKKLMQRYKIEQIPVIRSNGTIVDVILWIEYLTSDDTDTVEPKPVLQTPVVIMAGGKGTRLDPFTKILPKPLIPLDGKPIIEHIMDRFYRCGFADFSLIVNYKKEMIKLYFSENRLPYTITIIEEPEYCGTAGGLALLRDQLCDTFIMTNCDTILEGNYLDFLRWHQENRNILTIIGSHREITVPYGVLKMNNGAFQRIDEKPKFDLFINTGAYILEPVVLELIKDAEHLDMDTLLTRIQHRYQDRVGVYPHWDGWFDIGQWDEYKRSLEKIAGLL